MSLPNGGIASADNPIELVGEGSGAGGTAIAGASPVITLGNPNSTVSDLGIVMGGTSAVGLDTAGSATRIQVTGTNAAAPPAQIGVVLNENTFSRKLEDSTITLSTATGSDSTAVKAVSSTAPVIEDSVLSAARGVAAVRGSVVRTAITASLRGVQFSPVPFPGAPVTLTVDQATIRILDASGIALEGDATVGNGPASLTARHVTAVGPGSGVITPIGAYAFAACSGVTPYPSSVTLRNTILRGFATDLLRDGMDDCDVVGVGTVPSAASIDVAYSVYDPAKVIQESDAGSITTGAGNLDVDPMFMGPTDFRLQSTSPLIDVGDPAALGPGESTTDLAGNSRVVDGNGDSMAQRDIGAYEFIPPAPPPSQPPAGPAPSAGPTGLRAAALKKCKKKKGKARKKCRKRAQALPV